MRKLLPVLGGVGLGAAVAAVAGYQWTHANPARRNQVDRQMRVLRLSARRFGHLGLTKARKAVARDDVRRAQIDAQFKIRSAEDVAAVLGDMKGVVMKAGQMLSFLMDGLPPEAQAALATLQADVPPMAPSLAEQVVREELGRSPDRVFLEWDEIPVAAASIGQVHRAVTTDGRVVAVKVQYPGVAEALKGDLDNAELLYGLFAQFAMKNLDVRGMVDELRDRMRDELDYRHEAACQQEFVDLYAGHPFIRIPAVVPELSTARVLTSEWVDGWRFDELVERDQRTKEQAAEVLLRFSQGAIHRFGVFNGDPHPGNYRFHPDGTVTFLDFGLVKRWAGEEWERLASILDAIIDRDAESTFERAQRAGFVPEQTKITPERLLEYVSAAYTPFQVERFAYTRSFVGQALQKLADISGEYGDVIRELNMPPSYIILDRVVWGVTGILGRLEAEGPWRGVVCEYLRGGPPTTALGEAEARWMAARTG